MIIVSVRTLYILNLSTFHMSSKWKWVCKSPWLTGGLISAVTVMSAFLNTNPYSPPRFDGAGYAVLATSLASGQGYREIDRPGSPPHAHFPPGYPVVLASIWRLTGRSVLTAHLLSIGCTVAATLAAWRWFRFMESPRVAALLGLALAINWGWGRTSGSIQSEPLFILAQSAVLAGTRAGRRGGLRAAIQTGLLLAASILTRHVGVVLAAAVVVHLALQRRIVNGLIVTATATICLIPWIAWVSNVRINTQAELLTKPGLISRVMMQSLFYLERIPDQLTGPVVEVSTVFSRSLTRSWIGIIWATLATSILLVGLARTLRSARRRIVGLIGFFTLGLLLVWPFTEAGRFLIPLVPCLLIAAVEGFSPFIRQVGQVSIRHKPKQHDLFKQSQPTRTQTQIVGIDMGGQAADRLAAVPNSMPDWKLIPSVAFGFLLKRTWMQIYRSPKITAAAMVLAISVPYPVYAIASGRSEVGRRSYQSFDAACSWLANEATLPGPVLSRDPGEVFWLSGRQAIPPGGTLADIEAIISEFRVSYILIDDGRYANHRSTHFRSLSNRKEEGSPSLVALLGKKIDPHLSR